jgi:hypothetical protein
MKRKLVGDFEFEFGKMERQFSKLQARIIGSGKIPDGDLRPFITKEILELRNRKYREFHGDFAKLD